jgi:hypothetical protein
MRGEFDLFGIYLPPLLPAIALAWLLTLALIRALNRMGFYHLVWHRPLANLALYVVVLGGTVFGLALILPHLRPLLPT